MIIKEIKDSIKVKEKIIKNKTLIKQIKNLAETCLLSLKKGGKIILAGNGGSFADAQHISAEFTSRYMKERESLPSICLGTNNSAISAIGNDYGYESVFSRELESIAKQEDVFIGISTSGKSENLINAIKVANKKKIKVYALTGKSGGHLDAICECLKVPSSVTGRIQESHILIGHIICGIVEEKYFK
tara:strand:- start:5893 stop:6456 length:564 start_codon:yes stop_codon:yes gene_type:complete